jgi:hypothetical protein
MEPKAFSPKAPFAITTPQTAILTEGEDALFTESGDNILTEAD